MLPRHHPLRRQTVVPMTSEKMAQRELYRIELLSDSQQSVWPHSTLARRYPPIQLGDTSP